MTKDVITHLDQISTKWLTCALAKSSALTHGEVASFERRVGKGNWSTNAFLILRYSQDAKGLLPQRLFLKMVNTDLGGLEDFDDSEVTYYTRDYIGIDETPLLRCYDACYSKNLKRYHILLDDVSETHVEAFVKKPTLEYGLALAEGLAVLHAHWWGAQRLSETGASMHTAKHIQNFVDFATPGGEHILKRFSADLKSHWQEDLYEIFAKLPQVMMARTKNPNGFTLIHGDVGCKNVLVPQNADRPIYIIDRQPFKWSLTTWLGVYDLAYALVLDWDLETRRQYEIIVLKRYHEHLLKHGVLDYSWEQILNDYKLSVTICVFVATEYFRGGVNGPWVHVWLEMLQRALSACDDLECSMLWH